MKNFFRLSSGQIFFLIIWSIYHTFTLIDHLTRDLTLFEKWWFYFNGKEFIGIYDWSEYIAYMLGAFLFIVFMRNIDKWITHRKQKINEKHSQKEIEEFIDQL